MVKCTWYAEAAGARHYRCQPTFRYGAAVVDLRPGACRRGGVEPETMAEAVAPAVAVATGVLGLRERVVVVEDVQRPLHHLEGKRQTWGYMSVA